MFRRTINKEISCVGCCPFNGKISHVKLCPAKCGSGITFIRSDLINKLGEKSKIHVNKNADFDCSKLNTTISNGCCEVLMIEHLLSSLWSYKIKDIDIYVNCNEIPMLDGSANYWVKLLDSAGIYEFDEKLQYKKIDKEYTYKEGDKYIIARPCDKLKISYTISFAEKSIGQNTFIYDDEFCSYKKDISLARTFCTEAQVPNHLAVKKNFNHYDMVIYSENNVSIADGKDTVRYSNEPTRHKILDLIGDLISTGDFIQGEFICYKSGHAMNRKIIDLIYK